MRINWKDIVDEPKEKISLSIFLDKTRHFYIDPRFKKFKFTGTIIRSNKLCSQLYYKFSDEKSNIIRKAIIYTVIINHKTTNIGKCIIER